MEGFKILLTGSFLVGKSCILNQFVDNRFEVYRSQAKWLCFSKTKTIIVNDIEINLQIWDSSTRKDYKALVSSYYEWADGFIIVFDVSDAESFQALSSWIHHIDRYVPERKPTIIAGNKSDLKAERQVTFEEARSFAMENEMNYIEVSAKNCYNIKQLFDLLTREMISKNLTFINFSV